MPCILTLSAHPTVKIAASEMVPPGRLGWPVRDLQAYADPFTAVVLRHPRARRPGEGSNFEALALTPRPRWSQATLSFGSLMPGLASGLGSCRSVPLVSGKANVATRATP